MKQGLSKLAIVSVAIALSFATPAVGCKFSEQETTETTWFNRPWAMLLAVPGIALATGLYLGSRTYQRQG